MSFRIDSAKFIRIGTMSAGISCSQKKIVDITNSAKSLKLKEHRLEVLCARLANDYTQPNDILWTYWKFQPKKL